MNPPSHDADHGPALRVASNEAGTVTACPCGVVTLTMQYLSLRLEPGAFRALTFLLAQAQTRLDRFAPSPAEADEVVAEPPCRIH